MVQGISVRTVIKGTFKDSVVCAIIVTMQKRDDFSISDFMGMSWKEQFAYAAVFIEFKCFFCDCAIKIVVQTPAMFKIIVQKQIILVGYQLLLAKSEIRPACMLSHGAHLYLASWIKGWEIIHRQVGGLQSNIQAIKLCHHSQAQKPDI